MGAGASAKASDEVKAGLQNASEKEVLDAIIAAGLAPEDRAKLAAALASPRFEENNNKAAADAGGGGGGGGGGGEKKWERKYFLEEHERLLSKMVPPPTTDSQGAASATVSTAGFDGKIPTLADLTQMGAEINGSHFAQLLVASFLNLQDNMDRLNKENEFPIPDADTGTNMVICFKRAVRTLVQGAAGAADAAAASNLVDVTEAFANDAVMCGQGNSGTILAHFFKTLAEEVRKVGKPGLSPAEFAAVLHATAGGMRNAVSEVVEGTMISAARDGSMDLGEQADMKSLISAWDKKTQEAVKKTHDTLEKDGKKILEGQKGLDGNPKVDSGASGFGVVVEGMRMACEGAISAERMSDPTQLNPVGLGSLAGEDISKGEARGDLPDYPFQYCTEAAIKLKPGVEEKDVKALFEEFQKSGKGDSMALVCTATLAKLHIHTNEPGEVFRLALENLSDDPELLLKEKVEDMYVERDRAQKGAAYDMSDAKVLVVSDSILLPYHELDHATVFPIWIIDGVEPRVMGDKNVNVCEVANANRHYRAKEGRPKQLSTAAPTPQQLEMVFRQALDKLHNSKSASNILCITLGAMFSACDRNARTAVGLLPKDAQERITVYDSGYLGPNGLMAREAMRCAAKGMELEQIMERVKYVESRLFGFFILSSATMKNLAKWGRVVKELAQPPVKLKEQDVIDYEKEKGLDESRTVYSLGSRPTAGKPQLGAYMVGGPPEQTRPVGLRAVNTFAQLGDKQAGTIKEAIDEMFDVEIEAIKQVLKPGQKLMDVCIGTPIRQDISIGIGKKMKDAGLPIEGEINVIDSLVLPALTQYHEFIVLYWIDG